MKQISCGIIIVNNKNEVLGCLPCGRKDGLHDIPKGKMEINETFKQTAIRECFEETGIVVNPDELIDLNLHKYLKDKDLYLFQLNLSDSKTFPSGNIYVEDMYCSTFCSWKEGQELPEVVSYKWIDMNEVKDNFFVPLVKVFEEVGLI